MAKRRGPSGVDTDVDRGWAWVVCVACFAVVMLCLGNFRVSGILFVAFQEEFSGSASATASIMGIYSVSQGISMLVACNVLMEFMSARLVIMTGGLIGAFGISLGAFAQSTEMLMVTSGFIAGVGLGMTYVPAMITLGFRFEHRRVLANGLAFSGSCVGGVIYPPFTRFILDQYGLRGTMAIFGALVLNVIPAGMLILPSKDKVKRSERQRNLEESAENSVDNSLRTPENEADNSEIEDKQTQNTSNTLIKDTADDRIDITEEEPSTQISERKPERKWLSSLRKIILDKEVFCDPLFYIFLLIYILGASGVITFASFLPPVAKEKGIEDFQRAVLVSLYAGVDFLCRVTVGLVADKDWVPKYRLLAIAFLFIGTTYQLVRFYNTFALMIVHVVIVGFFSGCYMPLTPSIVVEFFGKVKFPKVYSIIQFTANITNTVMYPVVGRLRDITGNYVVSCHFLGTSMHIAGILLLFVAFVPRRNTNANG